MKIYIAGPMTGYTDYNRQAFNRAADALRHVGYEVVNPADIKEPCENPKWKDWMREAIKLLVDCDGVCLLPDSELSRGAKVEKALALGLYMEVGSLGGWITHKKYPSDDDAE